MSKLGCPFNPENKCEECELYTKPIRDLEGDYSNTCVFIQIAERLAVINKQIEYETGKQG